MQYRKILGSLDAAVFFNMDSTTVNPCFTYLSGFTGAGALIVKRRASMILITPAMELRRARKVFQGKLVRWRPEPLLKQIIRMIPRAGTVGYDADTLPVSYYKALKKSSNAKFVDVSDAIKKQRQIKSSSELAKISRACAIGDQVLGYIYKHWHEYKTESDIAAALRWQTAKKGYRVSFDPIVASGKNAAIPHHEPVNTPLQKGFCVIDYGVFVDNYASDMTRTVGIGKCSQKERKLYQSVLDLQEELVASATHGKRITELVQQHNSGLKSIGYRPLHALGHGIGIEVHESPSLSLKSKETLHKGMVIAIEPGIYRQNVFGIRIEDTVAIADTPRILTKTTKKLIVF